jgi:hypothetical protein
MTESVQAGGGLVEAPAFWRGVLLAGVAMVFWTAFALLNSAWQAWQDGKNGTLLGGAGGGAED